MDKSCFLIHTAQWKSATSKNQMTPLFGMVVKARNMNLFSAIHLLVKCTTLSVDWRKSVQLSLFHAALLIFRSKLIYHSSKMGVQSLVFCFWKISIFRASRRLCRTIGSPPYFMRRSMISFRYFYICKIQRRCDVELNVLRIKVLNQNQKFPQGRWTTSFPVPWVVESYLQELALQVSFLMHVILVYSELRK